MSPMTLSPDLQRHVRSARMQFLDAIEPHRRDLFRYCRSLTPTVWEAEDLAQDTLLRTFSKLGELHGELRRPRAFLFRVATNAWIDVQRRRSESTLGDWTEHPASDPEQPSEPEVREALETLTRCLPPRERTAVLLKDVFGFSLVEVARALDTTVGAVKAALHRGRTRLRQRPPDPGAPPTPRDAPSTELLDRFVAAFNARDLSGLTALLQVEAEAEVVGMVHELGRDQIRDGSLHHTLFDEAGEPRAQRVEWAGESLVVIWYRVGGDESVGDVLRFAVDEGAVRSLRYYYYCPGVLEEVTGELGLPVHTNGYRYRPKA